MWENGHQKEEQCFSSFPCFLFLCSKIVICTTRPAVSMGFRDPQASTVVPSLRLGHYNWSLRVS